MFTWREILAPKAVWARRNKGPTSLFKEVGVFQDVVSELAFAKAYLFDDEANVAFPHGLLPEVVDQRERGPEVLTSGPCEP